MIIKGKLQSLTNIFSAKEHPILGKRVPNNPNPKDKAIEIKENVKDPAFEEDEETQRLAELASMERVNA